MLSTLLPVRKTWAISPKSLRTGGRLANVEEGIFPLNIQYIHSFIEYILSVYTGKYFKC